MEKIKFNRCIRNEGSYNFCAPRDKQAQYCFYLLPDAPKDITCKSFVIEIDRDPIGQEPETALEAAEALQAYYEKAWIISSTDYKGQIAKIVDYLSTTRLRDRQADLLNLIAYTEKTLKDFKQELLIIEEEIDQERMDNSQFGVGA
jgi:hypothetical protein